MRAVKILSIVLLISLVFSINSIAAIGKMSDLQIKSIASGILDNMLEAFKRDDYFKYSQNLDVSLKQSGASTSFFETNRYVKRTLGDYQKRKFMGVLRKGDMVMVLWKGVFDKTSDHLLIKLMLTKKRGKFIVTGLWLQ